MPWLSRMQDSARACRQEAGLSAEMVSGRRRLPPRHAGRSPVCYVRLRPECVLVPCKLNCAVHVSMF